VTVIDTWHLVSELVGDLAEATSASIDSGLLDQLAREVDDKGAWHQLLTQQLARWRHDHPDATGLDEFAEVVVDDLEPARQRLLDQLAQRRGQR
jgi:hypothetical protein